MRFILIWIWVLYILISLTGFPLLWHRSNVRVILVSHIIDNYFAISSIYTGDKVCAHPSLDNSSRLLRIIRSKGTDVLYVGDPLLLQYTGNVKETFDELRTLLRGTPVHGKFGLWLIFSQGFDTNIDC